MKQYEYTLTYNGTPLVLDINPAGWDEVGIKYVRNRVYNSVLRSFTLNLRFYKRQNGGGQFILDAFEIDGAETIVDVVIKKLNPNTEQYDNFYTGILDFTIGRWKETRDFVEIGITDSSKLQKFISRDEENYDLRSTTSTGGETVPSFVSHPIDIEFLPINIYLFAELEGGINYKGGFLITSWGPFNTFDPVINYYYSENVISNQLQDSLKTSNNPVVGDQIVYSNDTSFEVEVQITGVSGTPPLGNFDVNQVLFLPFGGGSNYARVDSEVKYTVLDSDDNVLNEVITYQESQIAVNLPTFELRLFSFIASNLDVTINVPSGATLNLTYTNTPEVSSWSNMGAQFRQAAYIDLDINVTSEGEPSTDVECFLPHEAFTRLISLATDETSSSNILYSEALGRTDSEFQTYLENGEGSLDAITNGFSLRAFANKPINCNIRDLFKTFNAIYSLGLGYDRVNDRFFIEDIGTFYNKNELFDLGEVSELEISDYEEGYFNGLQSGYDNDVKYEEIDGLTEVLGQTEHNITIPVKDKKEFRAPYNADSLGMEFARRNQFINTSEEDTDYDDLIYVVRTDGDKVVQGNPNGGTLIGFIGLDERYNFALLPRENLIRQAGLVKSALWKKTATIKFVKSKIKTDIGYRNQNGDDVFEFDDIQESEFNRTKLFNPVKYKFKAPIDQTILDTLNADPHGFVKFNFDGQEYEGFIDDMTTTDYNEQAEFTLIGKDLSSGGENYIFEDNDNVVFEDNENNDNAIFELT